MAKEAESSIRTDRQWPFVSIRMTEVVSAPVSDSGYRTAVEFVSSTSGKDRTLPFRVMV